MKFLTLVTMLVVVLAATTSAQRRRCQPLRNATCVGARDLGTRCPTAPPRRLWYYNAANRTCVAMQHLGCGGNSNRWCSRRACERRCNRPTTAA